MQVTRLAISDVVCFEPRVFSDDRGAFFESFNGNTFKQATGLTRVFVQDNHSISGKGVLRGLHYQLQPHAQGKLVRVTRGAAYDVALDLRRSSPTYGRWVGELLTETNRKQMWIPEGFAHGFLSLSERTEFLYKTTEYFSPDHERCIRWNDPRLGIAWPTDEPPILSPKDSSGLGFDLAEMFE